MRRQLLAEVIGTAWLVLGGCGTAVLAGSHVGWLGVSLAFGLTVVTMAYAIGPVSGCHLNPAVTIGLYVARRFEASKVLPYVAAQVVGAILGAGALFVVAKGAPGADPVAGGFAANGFGDHSPGQYGLVAAFVAEAVLTAFFLVVILGATGKRAAPGFAGLAIGLALTLIHLVGIPVTNTSVNPARSTSQAVFVGGWALGQLWLFWIAPVVGALAGATAWRAIGADDAT